MSIESVKLFNITTFHRLEMQCSKGINIIIGGNGTGKTTLLKFIYASCEWSNKKTNRNKAKKISDYFSYDNCDMTKFKTYESNEHYSAFEIKYDGIIFEYRLNENVMCNLDNWLNKEVKSIFIPTMEMLSHSKGFSSLRPINCSKYCFISGFCAILVPKISVSLSCVRKGDKMSHTKRHLEHFPHQIFSLLPALQLLNTS